MITKKQLVNWLESLPDNCTIYFENGKLKVEDKLAKFLLEPSLDLEERKESYVS